MTSVGRGSAPADHGCDVAQSNRDVEQDVCGWRSIDRSIQLPGCACCAARYGAPPRRRNFGSQVGTYRAAPSRALRGTPGEGGSPGPTLN
jgi:hypothetical protein